VSLAEDYTLLDLHEPADLPATTRREREEQRRSSRRRSGFEWVIVGVGAFCVWFVVQMFVAQAFTIPSESMEPTLMKGDRVLVNKVAHRFGDVHRGDVVVFEGTASRCGTFHYLVKRVVGLPGETVEGRGGRVWVDGEPLAEDYLPAGVETRDFDPVVVPGSSYWMMGDNRVGSCDSRVFGPVEESAMVGPVAVRFWPPNRFGRT